MTQVRIRHANDFTATQFTDVPLDQIDTVIPTLTSWGVFVDGSPVIDDQISGQFVYEPSSKTTYFEVVLGDEG